MNTGRYAELQRLFHAARDQPADARSAWLAGQCAGDTALFDEVTALLKLATSEPSAWVAPPGALVQDALLDFETSSVVGRHFGPYVATGLIGYGGMGAVYEGQRADEQFAMRVAIKLLRRGADSELAVRRFRYERQILANLKHRNIAALLDGGVTDDGQPYFVMEYVEGQTITAYCHQRVLTVRQRVQLLRQVCGAVQHAHEALVVHRDLKPGNILVTDDGTVKLLDFGIARLMRAPGGLDNLPPTEGAAQAFTPDYASPEQFLGLPAQPATDIYSLGVIACELLSGHRPHALDGLLLRDMQARVCETPAPLPSQLATQRNAERAGAGSAARLQSQLRGDLDAIVSQALRKEPDRRYRTAEQLNADLQRFLDGHPVQAQRDRLGYRIGKFLARRRVEVLASSLVLLALVTGTIVSLRAAARAERERAKATQVNDFLQTMLGAANPDVLGRDVTVAQVLGQAARDLASRTLTPEIEGDIRLTLASTYYALGVFDSADVHAAQAYRLRQSVYGLRDVRTTTALTTIANIAEALGQYERADSAVTTVVRELRAMRPVDANALASALDVQARVVEQLGRLDEAERIKRDLLALRRQGTDSASRAGLSFALTNLATTLLYRGDMAGAEALQREALVVEASVHGTDKPNYADIQRGLAGILEEAGQFAVADSIMQQALPTMRRTLGPTHSSYLRALNAAARLRLRSGDAAGAIPMSREVVAAIGGALPEADVTAGSALQVLGAALDSVRQVDEAEAVYKRALDLRRRTLAPDNWVIGAAEAQLGAHYLLVHRHDLAEPLLTRGYTLVAKEHGLAAPYSVGIAKRIVLLYQEMKQPRRVAEWQARVNASPPAGSR